MSVILPAGVEPTMVPAPPTPPVPVEETLRKNGILMLDKEFNQENIMPLVKQIIEWNLLPEVPFDEIKLYINSPGGVVFSANHLIDVMKQSNIPVSTIAQGLAASCGVLTLMAGHKGKRYATHNTSIMSHQYAWGSQGKEHELYGKIKEFEISSYNMIQHYKKCTGKSEAYIRKHLLGPTDVWMTPEEAKKHGLIDEVIHTY